VFTKDERGQLLNAVERAIRQTLSTTFGRNIEVVIGKPRTSTSDAVFVFAAGGPPLSFDVELKTSVTPATIAALSAHARISPMILFCPRLTPAVIDACRHLGVACADADGNLFLRSESSAVDIQGRPPEASRQLVTGGNRAARLTGRSGLQILFVLLSEPAFRDEPFRAVAAAAGTSLGSVAAVFQEMERRGYLTTTSRGRTLRQAGQLLDMWVDGYRLRLFERLRLGTFTTDVAEWWSTSNNAVRSVDGQWGSETALWATGRNLRPARGVLYVDALPAALVTALRLRRDPRSEAPVEFRRRFWDMPEWYGQETVPKPLIYADLLADGDPRLVEAAAELRKNDDDLRRLDQS
jgi:hypothetical protein